MATDIDDLQIHITSEAAGASKSLNNLVKKLEKLSTAINAVDANKVNAISTGFKAIGVSGNTTAKGINVASKSAIKAVKSFDSLAASLGKYYAMFALLTKGTKSIWKNVESSMDYVETSNYFSVALGQIGQQFEKAGYESAELYTEALTSELSDLNKKLTGYTWGASGEALFGGDVGLGMDIEQIMNFQAKTLAVTNSVGLMGDASIETAKAVSMLAGDLSSLTNTDLESVMTNLSSGLIGQSRALYKYGIDITQNTLQQYALAEGIEKSVSEMTQAEKMQLRLLAILDQSTVAQGDLSVTISSVANQYRVFEQQIDNTGRTLGNLFLPIVQNVLPYVNGLIIALNNLFTSLGFEIYGETWLEDLQDGISGGAIDEDFEDISDSADDATESLNEFKKGIRGIDELNVISTGSNTASITDELESTIDLTDSITKAVADYENSWNSAFATAENKASEFAKQLTEEFGGVAEMFDAIFPAITGIGTALATYKIASGISGITSALGVLGTPLGIASLATGTLVGVTVALKDLWEEAKSNDIAGRFGDISLSLEDIDKVARAILDNKNLSGVSSLLSELSELSGIESEIESAVSTLDRLNWKVSVGLELTEEEQGQYKSAIDSYISSVNTYVEQQQYAANIGIKLFLFNSQTSEEVQSVVNEFYSGQSEKLRKLGEELNKVTTAAWNDGLLSIDEAETIANIQQQMAEIQNTLSASEFQARLQILEGEYSGAALTSESYQKLVEKRNKLFEDYKSDLNESLVFSLAQINLAYQAKIDAASTQQAKEALKKDWDNAIKEMQLGRDSQIAEMTLNALSFDYDTLIGAYGEELDKVVPEIASLLDEAAANISFLSSTAKNESAINGYLQQLKKDIDKVLKELPPETRANLKEFINALEPSSDLEAIAKSYFERTGEVPQAITDALSSLYAIKSITGSKEDMLNALLVDANSVEARQITTAMNTLGIDSIDAFANGIMLQTPIGEKAVTDYLEEIADLLEESSFLSGNSFGKTEKKASSLNTLLEKMNNGTIPNLAEQFGLVTGESEKVEFSIGELGKAIDEVNKKAINIPVSIGGGGSSGLNLERGMFSPNFSLKTYANGGLVDSGSIFVARENGIPELVGRFGNQTMVANNGQIVDAIRQAAYEGYKMAIAESGGNRYSGGDTVVNIDGREVFRAVRKEEQSNFNRTGNSVFVH